MVNKVKRSFLKIFSILISLVFLTNFSLAYANQTGSDDMNVNLEQAKNFLEKNKTEQDIVTLASGLQYKIINKNDSADAKSPTATQSVTVHYAGKLIDGTEFDSSYKRAEPTTFRVNQVIKGWQEALQLMKVGEKWELYIPPELGYGERGAGQTIGPNSLLIFEVELISIG